jgi:hypothetical protein
MRKEITDGVHRRDTTKAIDQETYGSPEVLQLREIDTPDVGDDEVLVQVHAAGVDQSVDLVDQPARVSQCRVA